MTIIDWIKVNVIGRPERLELPPGRTAPRRPLPSSGTGKPCPRTGVTNPAIEHLPMHHRAARQAANAATARAWNAVQRDQ
jgi:hypothetical protein